MWPKGGDISVGPYSSTATAGDEVGDDAADLIADARPAVMSARSRCKAGRSVVAPENPPSSYTQQKNIGRLRIFIGDRSSPASPATPPPGASCTIMRARRCRDRAVDSPTCTSSGACRDGRRCGDRALAGDEGFAGFALRLRDIGQQPAEPRPTHRRRLSFSFAGFGADGSAGSFGQTKEPRARPMRSGNPFGDHGQRAIMLALILKPVVANEDGVGMPAPLTDQSRADFRDERGIEGPTSLCNASAKI